MLFYLRNNLEADIPGAAGSAVGLTRKLCPRAGVSTMVWEPRRGFESKRTLPLYSPSFAVSEKLTFS